MRVLVVHAANQEVGIQSLQEKLVENGISCEVSCDAAAIAKQLGRERFDLAVVSLDLDADFVGEILHALRTHAPAAGIHWFEPGDDPAELLQRLKSLNWADQEPTHVEVGSLTIDYLTGSVTRSGVLLDLTPTEYSILRCLVIRCGNPLSRSELLASVWGINSPTGTNVVDVAIRRLRAKLDDPFESPLVRTVRGEGYMFESQTTPLVAGHASSAD